MRRPKRTNFGPVPLTRNLSNVRSLRCNKVAPPHAALTASWHSPNSPRGVMCLEAASPTQSECRLRFFPAGALRFMSRDLSPTRTTRIADHHSGGASLTFQRHRLDISRR